MICILIVRNSFIGLKGIYGTLFFGTHDTTFKRSHSKIDVFNENVLLAYTRAQFSSLRLSKEAQKEASEPQGTPLDASGEVLGRS